ncbi:adenylate/guanylate cyclase domain-containing protein [Azospirillum thermophilum]|nr:adenylate/guanylate cyclase domain-containing protein [Azospirillum thermophilum]
MLVGTSGLSAAQAARWAGRGKGPERKLLTILFVDIVNSSAMVVGRDPEDADEGLLTILNILVEAVARYDGMVSQLLGDGFMAVFGAPTPRRTTRCAPASRRRTSSAPPSIPRFPASASGSASIRATRWPRW